MSDAQKSRSPEARRQRRISRALWRREILARVIAGEKRCAIAEEQGISLSTVKRAVARALKEAPPEPPETHIALQFERVAKALRLADRLVDKGDLAGVYALAALAPLLDRYRATLAAGPGGRPPGGVAHHLNGNIFELLEARMSRLP